jgi:hypothetical protein
MLAATSRSRIEQNTSGRPRGRAPCRLPLPDRYERKVSSPRFATRVHDEGNVCLLPEVAVTGSLPPPQSATTPGGARRPAGGIRRRWRQLSRVKKIGFGGAVALVGAIATVVGLYPTFGSYFIARDASAPHDRPSASPGGPGSPGIPSGPVSFAALPLQTSTDIKAIWYFGQHSAVLNALGGHVDLTGDRGGTAPDRCVSTVVFFGVSSPSLVYANGLGAGWTAAENPPPSGPYGSESTVRQQLIIPPKNPEKGQRWVAWDSLLLPDGGPLAISDKYAIQVLTTSPVPVWQANSSRVICAAPI